MVQHLTFKNPDEYAPGEIIIPANLIDQRIDELTIEIARDFKNSHVLIVGLLIGGSWFAVDLLARLFAKGIKDSELTFMKITSYTVGTDAIHEPRIEYDLPINPKDRHVLIVDDIVDTGRSLKLVESLIQSKDVLRCQSVVLLDKPERREVEYKAGYTGFVIPNIWVQGRGMDTDGYGRADPNIIKGPFTY